VLKLLVPQGRRHIIKVCSVQRRSDGVRCGKIGTGLLVLRAGRCPGPRKRRALQPRVLTPYLVNLTEMPRHARAIGPTCGHTQSPVAASVDSHGTRRAQSVRRPLPTTARVVFVARKSHTSLAILRATNWGTRFLSPPLVLQTHVQTPTPPPQGVEACILSAPRATCSLRRAQEQSRAN